MNNTAEQLFDLIDPNLMNLITAQDLEQWDTAMDVQLRFGIDHLERNKKNFEPLKEEGLSAVLTGSMQVPGINVYQEANSNGHVDVTIESMQNKSLRTLGEAKIYSGPQKHLDGVGQLIGYLTGREGRAFLVEFVRKAGVANLMKKVREKMEKAIPDDPLEVRDHPSKWAFISVHRLSTGDDHEIAHVGCDLHIAPAKKKASG